MLCDRREGGHQQSDMEQIAQYDMCTDMRTDMCTDMCADMCTSMCIEFVYMHVYTHVYMFLNTHVDLETSCFQIIWDQK